MVLEIIVKDGIQIPSAMLRGYPGIPLTDEFDLLVKGAQRREIQVYVQDSGRISFNVKDTYMVDDRFGTAGRIKEAYLTDF